MRMVAAKKDKAFWYKKLTKGGLHDLVSRPEADLRATAPPRVKTAMRKTHPVQVAAPTLCRDDHQEGPNEQRARSSRTRLTWSPVAQVP